MHPVVLALTLLASLGVLFLPKRHALGPLLAVAFLTPFGQQLFLGGVHFFAVRIIIIAGLIRVMRSKVSSATPLFRQGIQPIDKMIFALAILHATTFTLLFRDIGAVTYQLALGLDACGGYLLYRCFIQDREAVALVAKTLVFVAAVLAVCMGYEYLTRVNVFSFINGSTIVPLIRDGRVRAQGTFANSITAGIFGATLLPLSFWLWKGGNAKLPGLVGIAASTVISITSMASTGITAYLGAILALGLWPARKEMRILRRGIVFTVLGLAIVMKAPVWFIIARVDFVGGHAWDRAELIDAAVRHISDWWLIGTAANASWGNDTWDACNEFVYQGTSGGLASLILFIFILSRAFSMIGNARRRAQGRKQEWLLWCLGAVLFTHMTAFWGTDYFDTIRVWWLVTLAMIPAATLTARAPAAKRVKMIVDWKSPAAVYGAQSTDTAAVS